MGSRAPRHGAEAAPQPRKMDFLLQQAIASDLVGYGMLAALLVCVGAARFFGHGGFGIILLYGMAALLIGIAVGMLM